MTSTTLAKRRNSVTPPAHDCARYECDRSSYEHTPALNAFVDPQTARDYARSLLWTALADRSVTHEDAWTILDAAGLGL